MARRGQGPRLVYLEKREGYYIRWTEKGRTREKSCATGDQRAAEAFLAAWLAERGQSQSAGTRDPARFPVIDALQAYALEHAPHTACPERIGYAIDALAAFWGDNMVIDITDRTCRAYGDQRGRSPGTIGRELSCLRAAIRYAERQGRLTHAPHVWLPPRPLGKDRWLTRDEAARLLRAARSSPQARMHLPLFILIGLYSGARAGAILSLRWPQVDLARGRIDFNPPGRAQTAKRRPIIPIPRRLMTFLRLARLRGADLGYVLHIDGRPIESIKKSFRAAAINAGFRKQVGVTENGQASYRATVSPHVLRHTAGTWMAQHDVPLFEVAGYLGHSHARTSELYAHHSPCYLERARGAFD